MTATVQTADVALRDGSTVRVRAVRHEDEPELRALLDRLSEDSRWLRFFSAGVDLDRKAGWAASMSGGRGFGVVATLGTPERIVGHAAYVRENSERAEIAFEVEEEMHGLGIGTILLAHLAEAAERDGIRTFTATVHPTNHRMAHVLRDSGFPVEVTTRPGELLFELPASLDADAAARFEDRDGVAAVAAVAHVLNPMSIALIGASRRSGTVGAAVLENLASRGYSGELYIVHPHADRLADRATFHSIADVPGAVDLAVIAVPADAVVDVARDCGAAGVRALVVLSAGFAEVGGDGVRRQQELLETCRASGMRLVGPNCLGVIATRAGLDATFAPEAPAPGRIAFASQSGAFGIAGDRRGGPPRPRPVVVRLDGQQGRPVRQRLHSLLGPGLRHRRDPALPRVLRQSAPLRPDRPRRLRAQADRGGQERPLGGRRARRVLAHGRAARGVGRDGRRALRSRRRDQDRHRLRAARRRRPARLAAAPSRRPGGDRDQRRRPRDRLRRRVHRHGAPGGPARDRASSTRCAGISPPRPRSATPST